jgi:amidase
MHRICLVILLTGLLFGCSSEQQQQDLHQLSAVQLAQQIASGELSSEQVVSHYLSRIEQLDPKINSVITVNPNALQEAKSRDKQVKNGEPLGVLHGVPVLVKDNIETLGMPTTAGSIALIKNDNNRDAPIIAKLRQQGAIILGKTNLSEWANFRSNESISGWSAIGGQTYNPHSLERSPCGSSSGSGAAVAAQLAPLALGTETNGSITCPAAMNGITGFKPTVGLLSRTHIVPISFSQDTAGPMTRSVEDAALMLNALAGSEPLDQSTAAADQRKTDYLTALQQPVKGIKVGVLNWAKGKHPSIPSEFATALQQLELAGVELVDINDELELPETYWQDALTVLYVEFKYSLNHYLSTTDESKVAIRSLEELIEFNNKTPRELVLFDQDLFEAAQASESIEEKGYQQALQSIQLASRENGIDKLLGDYGVDLLIAPSRPAAFLIDVAHGDSYPDGAPGAGWLAAIAGYPIATVPMGEYLGLPLGISFIGGKWADAKVLQLANAYEQASQKIRVPTFAVNARQHPASKAAMQPL